MLCDGYFTVTLTKTIHTVHICINDETTYCTRLFRDYLLVETFAGIKRSLKANTVKQIDRHVGQTYTT